MKPESHTVEIQSVKSEERNLQTEEEEEEEEEGTQMVLSEAAVTVSSFLKYSLKHQ